MSIFDGTTGEDPVPPVRMPAMAAPPAIVPKPGWQGGIHGLFDKLEEGVKSAASQAGDNLMPTPDALHGLLTDQDVSQARRRGLLQLGIALSQGRGENPLQSLGRGLAAAQQGFHDQLDSVVQQKKDAEAEQQRQTTIKQQQTLLANRASIARQFQAPPGETPEATDARLRQMAVAYANANDPEMATKLGGLVKDLHVTPGALHTIDTGANKVTTDAYGNTIRTDAVTESPAQKARADAAASAAGGVASRAEAAQKQATIRQQNVIVHDFTKTTEDYHAAEAAFGVLKAAESTPNNFMQPMAALDALARMLNPKGAVRVGTLQILKSQGSLGDRITRNIDMLKSGKWPAGMQAEVFQMAHKIMAEHTEDFEAARDEAIARGDAQGVDVRPLLHATRKENAATGNTGKPAAGKLGSYR